VVQGGIAYHHVSDTYTALFSHFIPCRVWEAIYILEGLLKNSSDIQPTMVHADTQGQSTPVHALSFLLGIKRMPRIRNWKEVVPPEQGRQVSTHRQPVQRHHPLAADPGSLARPAAGGSLGQGRHDLVRPAVAPPGSYSRRNRLYQAFRELGRVVQTVFLLAYLSNPQLREQITATTNKVEAYNGFAKWLNFGGQGVIDTIDPVEQERHLKYTRAVRELQADGYFMQLLAERGQGLSGEEVAIVDLALAATYRHRGVASDPQTQRPEHTPLMADLLYVLRHADSTCRPSMRPWCRAWRRV